MNTPGYIYIPRSIQQELNPGDDDHIKPSEGAIYTARFCHGVVKMAFFDDQGEDNHFVIATSENCCLVFNHPGAVDWIPEAHFYELSKCRVIKWSVTVTFQKMTENFKYHVKDKRFSYPGH